MPPKAKKTYTPPKSLDAFHTSQEKRFGSRLVRRDAAVSAQYIPTGSIGLDMALGGGWRTGRIHQIVGQPGSAKTSLALKSMANAQQMFSDKAVGYIDVERTWEWEWAEALGVDLDTKKRLTYIKVDSSEDVSDVLRDMLRSELFSLVTVDSIGGMERAQVIYEKDAEESDMGKNAQVISRLCKQCAVIGDNTNTATLLINQYRKNFSGGQDQAAGPMILGYTTTDSVAMRRTWGEGNTISVPIDDEEIEISRKIVAKVERSKIFAQGRKAEFWFTNVDTPENGPIGIDEASEVFIMAKKCGALTNNGNWWNLPDGTKENGERAVKARFRAEPDLLNEVRQLCVQSVEGDRIPETDVQFEVAQ
jgi:recombination protein RecA